MGILTPLCLVSNGPSVYGVTVTSNYAEGADPTQWVVLFKTNDNPDSLVNFRWNIVSTVQIGAVYDISQRTSPLCSIDAKGVFTYVDLSVVKSPGAPSMTAGIRYSPDFPPNTGGTSTSPGGWKNIDTAGPYPWEETSKWSNVFNVPDASGNLVSVYAWMVGYVSNLQFGYLDNASLQLRTGSTWTLPTSISIIDISYFNQTLYLLFKELVQLDDKYGLLTIPFNSSVIPAAAPTNYTGLGYQIGWTGKPSPLVAGFCADNYYAIRRYNYGWSVDDVLTVINFASVKDAKFRDDVNLTEPIDMFFDTTSRALWATIGGSNGVPTFGFYNRFDHSNSTHISLVHLDGPNVGKWEYASWKINVTEPYGVYLYPPPPRTGPPESSSSSASTGLIAGCVMGGLVIISIAVFLFAYCTRKMTRKLNEENAERQQQQNVAAQLGVSPDVKQNLYEPQNIPRPTAFVGTDYVQPTNSIPAPAFEAPLHQQIRLSSHPRPTMVSTLGGDLMGSKAEIEEDMPIHHQSSQLDTPQIPRNTRPPQ